MLKVVMFEIHSCRQPLSIVPPLLTHPSLESDPIGDFVQPASQRFAPRQAPGPSEEHEKRCLEGVVGRLRAAEHAPTHAEHHAAVPLQERSKRRFIPIQSEALQQLPVTKPLRAVRDSAKPANCNLYRVQKHGTENSPPSNICPAARKRIQLFSMMAQHRKCRLVSMQRRAP